jgi:(1->4)-alpha-D-glucan 1-alpha-D-glucosylmutase
MPETWGSALARFSEINAPHRLQVDNTTAPDANEEYFLYQTLLGAWPLEPYTADQFVDFTRRIQDYMVKALHEAKVHSSWISPNEAYDAAMRRFVEVILSNHDHSLFITELLPLARRISRLGMVNSMAQTLLKMTAPGVPDLYQGTELWDFSLVDPDNRRPVDYPLRQKLLRELDDELARPGCSRLDVVRRMLESPEDGRIKLYVIATALRFRREHARLFSTGEYFPLEPQGPKARHVFGSVRAGAGEGAIIVVPRLASALLGNGRGWPLGTEVWEDTHFELPAAAAQGVYESVLTGVSVTASRSGAQTVLPAAKLFAEFPVALLVQRRTG